MLITDSQVHIWKAEVPVRTWPAGHISPEKPNGWTAEQMVAMMDGAGVDRAVIVPPVWCGDSLANEHAFEACDRFPGRFAIMARFDQHAARAACSGAPITPWVRFPTSRRSSMFRKALISSPRRKGSGSWAKTLPSC